MNYIDSNGGGSLAKETSSPRCESRRELGRGQFRQKIFLPNSIKGLRNIELDQVFLSDYLMKPIGSVR